MRLRSRRTGHPLVLSIRWADQHLAVDAAESAFLGSWENSIRLVRASDGCGVSFFASRSPGGAGGLEAFYGPERCGGRQRVMRPTTLLLPERDGRGLLAVVLRPSPCASL